MLVTIICVLRAQLGYKTYGLQGILVPVSLKVLVESSLVISWAMGRVVAFLSVARRSPRLKPREKSGPGALSRGDWIEQQWQLPRGKPARFRTQTGERLRRLWSVTGAEKLRFGMPLLSLKLLELDGRR